MSDTYSQFIANFTKIAKDKIEFDRGEEDLQIIIDILNQTNIKRLLDNYDDLNKVIDDFELKFNNII